MHPPGPIGLTGGQTARVLAALGEPHTAPMAYRGSPLVAGIAAGLVHPGECGPAAEACVGFLREEERDSLTCSGAGAVAAAVAWAIGRTPGAAAAGGAPGAAPEGWEGLIGSAQQGAFQGQRLGRPAVTPSIPYRLQFARNLLASERPFPDLLQELHDLVGSGDRPHEAAVTALTILVLAGGDPSTAIVYAANLGGRADLVASLAGAIGGAAQPEPAFPPAWAAALADANPGLNLEKAADNLMKY